MLLHCGHHTIDLQSPLVMGVLNVTPDSFSDGGEWLEPSRAVDHALKMIEEGARIIDVGGESTRPGAANVSTDEELRRVVPVIHALGKKISQPISVDTSDPAVMRAAVDAGASIINDVRALQRAGALEAASKTQAAICVMHMQGEPKSMQADPGYADVVQDVRQFLVRRMDACEKAGIGRERLIVDPGIGFGKTVEHNLLLLAETSTFCELAPVLIGVSRKSVIGALTGRAIGDRLAGGLAFATAAVLAGASIIRAHDVAPTVDAVKVANALKQARSSRIKWERQ